MRIPMNIWKSLASTRMASARIQTMNSPSLHIARQAPYLVQCFGTPVLQVHVVVFELRLPFFLLCLLQSLVLVLLSE